LAYAAFALALALLAPTFAPLSESMDAVSSDLANGTFRPFGAPDAGGDLGFAFSDRLGGLTGYSDGNYLPGEEALPPAWVLDRDGRGGHVVIDYVFNPALGAMKRLKAYDTVNAEGTTLAVADTGLRRLELDPAVKYDPNPIRGRFDVKFSPDEPIPIYSVHPRALITKFATTPAVAGGVTFLRDGADTLYAVADHDGVVTLDIEFLTGRAYYQAPDAHGFASSDYAPRVRPNLPPQLVEDAAVVLARAGLEGERDVGVILDGLTEYFRAFTEGPLPTPSEVDSLYLALGLSGHGCCRHRAFAFMITAQAAGIPTRTVVNEAHAFVEVLLPTGLWHQINLGGCGTYETNNPEDYPPLTDAAEDPRNEANPDETRDLPVVETFTDITDSPPRIVKGETYRVNGTVTDISGNPVPGARIDVYLNQTKTDPGNLTGSGSTDARGRFSVEAKVPRSLPAQSYQLVARSAAATGREVRYQESWSDPPVDVFTPTHFVFPLLRGAAGFPTTLTGRLLDTDDQPVIGASVRISATKPSDATAPSSVSAATDGTGRFTANLTFDDVGRHGVTFTYEGDDHHGPTTREAQVTVDEGAILLPGDAPLLVRGQRVSYEGRVAVAGVSLAGHSVIIEPLGAALQMLQEPTTTQNDGTFAAVVFIDAAQPPDLYGLRVRVPDLGLVADGLVRVAIQPTLELRAPGSIPGNGFALTARLVSDTGDALAGQLVVVDVDGNSSRQRALLTNATGHARFAFPGDDFGIGAHTFELSFPGTNALAPASAQITLQRPPPWYASITPQVYALGAALILLAGFAVWAMRPGSLARRAVTALTGDMTARWVDRRIVVTFPDHPDGVPPVYAPGDPVHAHLRVEDSNGYHRPARLRLRTADGHRVRARTSNEVPWAWAGTAPTDGSPLHLQVRAAWPSSLRIRPLDLEVPVHDYRWAVEAGFVALRDKVGQPDSTTAGELLQRLGEHVGPAAWPRLREAARMFDAADYSDAPVDRAFYHAFMRAVHQVERSWEARHG